MRVLIFALKTSLVFVNLWFILEAILVLIYLN